MSHPRELPTGPVERIGEEHAAEPSWFEHRARYNFAAELAASRRVLDVACGSGFGSAILADAGASSVVGVDRAPAALQAAAGYRSDVVSFERAEIEALPFQDEAFDLVVCFETIEHVADVSAALAELRRVLRSDGSLVISTPNPPPGHRPGEEPANPFHLRELGLGELSALLGSRFDDVRLFGQRPSARYRPCPYWETEAALPTGVRGIRILAWKLRLRLARALPARPRVRMMARLFPGEHDFCFDRERPELGHVLVGIARPEPRSG